MHAPRVMGVLKPPEVDLENWPEGDVEIVEAPPLLRQGYFCADPDSAP